MLCFSTFFCVRSVWYKGKIANTIPNNGAFDVVYDTGYGNRELYPHCIRRFEPYEVDEYIQFRNVETEEYEIGKIIAIDTDGNDDISYTVESFEGYDDDESKILWKDITSAHLRRFPTEKFAFGERIWIRLEGDEEWYRGTVLKAHGDGYYSILHPSDDYPYKTYLHKEYFIRRYID